MFGEGFCILFGKFGWCWLGELMVYVWGIERIVLVVIGMVGWCGFGILDCLVWIGRVYVGCYFWGDWF